MLLGNLFKLLVRVSPAIRTPVRQLSGATISPRVIEPVNLNSAIEHLGKEVQFYQLTRVDPQVARGFNSDNLAVIPQANSFGQYSHTNILNQALKTVEANVPFAKNLRQQWATRPQTEIEAKIGRALSSSMPWVDFSVVALFPFLFKAGYFLAFRPMIMFSGLGSASTIKVITNQRKEISFKSDDHLLFVLVPIDKEKASTIPLSELAIMFVDEENHSRYYSGSNNDD